MDYISLISLEKQDNALKYFLRHSRNPTEL